MAGMAEYGAAFGDADALAQAEVCFDKMTEWYYHPENDPFKITPKGYAETHNERAASVPMVMLSIGQQLRRCMPEKAEKFSSAVYGFVQDIRITAVSCISWTWTVAPANSWNGI